MTTADTYTKIYTDLGYLFYSMAAGDGAIRKAETDELKRVVNKHWLPLEDSIDQFGTDSAHYIGISFDYVDEEGLSAEDAYARFADGFQERGPHYDAKMKALVMKTLRSIADAFYGTNKAEQAMLDRVEKLLGR